MNLSTRCLLLVFMCVGGYSSSYAQTKPKTTKPRTAQTEAAKSDPKRGQAEQASLDLVLRDVKVADFNGSVFRIDGATLRNLSVTNLNNALAGVVPGYFSRQTSGGMADESSSYYIRGQRSNSNGVLTLVDGQERSFGMLSPHEIESIVVLKDATVAALYGMRAPNGIVLINTRQGKVGTPRVEFTAQFINQQPVGMIDPVGAADYARHYNAALMSDGSAPEYSAFDIRSYELNSGKRSELYPDVDWMGKYFRESSWVQRYNINISGGIPQTQYFVNAGYTRQGGMFNTDNEFSYPTNNRVERYNLRSNLKFELTKSTKLGIDLYGWYDILFSPGPGTNEVYQALLSTPSNAFPEWFEDDGSYLDKTGEKVSGLNGRIVARSQRNADNPWAMLNRNGYVRLNKIYGSFRTQLSQDFSFITPGLKASLTLSMDSYTVGSAQRKKPYASYRYDPATPGVLIKNGSDGVMGNTVGNKNGQRSTTFNGQVSYARSWKKHNVTGLAFYEQYENTDDTAIPARYQGLGGWFGYNYGHRYGVDFTMSYHGSYKFKKGDNYGYFPAVSAGWTVSNEPFFKGLRKVVPYLKFRASYGKTGNDGAVDQFSYRSRMQSASDAYITGGAMGNTLAGFVESVIANPYLTWEEATQFNVGVDLRLFRDRLSVTADYFKDERTKMYQNNGVLSSLLGMTTTVGQNLGAMYTRGCELAVSWRDQIGKVTYTVGGTYSFSRNKITEASEIEQPYPWMQTAGYFRSIKRGYIAEGFFNSWEEIAAAPAHTISKVQPGDVRYKDVNGDGIIDPNDRVPIGYTDIPDVFYGIQLGLSYKGIGLNALFQGGSYLTANIGGKVAYPFNGTGGTIYEHQLNYWTPETAAGANMPRVSNLHGGSLNNSQGSTLWSSKADYLRLKNVELSYDFPQSIFKKSFIKGVRVFAGGYNLFTWSGFDLLDPDDNADSSTMPLTRNFSFGCSIKF